MSYCGLHGLSHFYVLPKKKESGLMSSSRKLLSTAATVHRKLPFSFVLRSVDLLSLVAAEEHDLELEIGDGGASPYSGQAFWSAGTGKLIQQPPFYSKSIKALTTNL